MKLLAAILVFMITAQPVQAGFCDMQPSGDSAANAGMQHDGMQHSSMKHGDTQHSGSSHPSGHDCCDPGNEGHAQPGSACGHNTACGSCSTGLSAAVASVEIPTAWNNAYRPGTTSSYVEIRHTSPPFRPPIDLS
jgi:hypothetical protein